MIRPLHRGKKAGLSWFYRPSKFPVELGPYSDRCDMCHSDSRDKYGWYEIVFGDGIHRYMR